MTKDEMLIQETINTFAKVKSWVDPDFYKEHILPTVKKLKDHLYLNNLKELKDKSFKEHSTEPDTVPSKFTDITNYGIFKDD